MTVFDPMTKMLIAMAAAALSRQLDLVKTKHASDHRVVDAINTAEKAIDGALQALLTL